VIYVQRDDKVRNARIVRHQVDNVLVDEDIVIYEEHDESVWLSLEVSKCKNYFLMIKVCKDGSEVDSE
jgi:protease II